MPLKFHHFRLKNGLDVIAEADADAHSFAAGLYINTGSRDESPQVAGVSHFLEHMMFKGSEKYSWEDVNRIFDELGARYNAFTTQENTAYYINVLPEFTARAVEHLSNLLRPAIRQADFDTEKKVILEEIAMHRDDPGYRVYEAAMEKYFAGHPLSQSVLGSVESITNLSRDQMAEYFRKQYGPGNMVLAAAGKLDFDEIVSLAEKYCGDWPSGSVNRQYPKPSHANNLVSMRDEKLNRTYTMGMMPGPSAQDETRFAARVLGDVIGESEGSRLYWALVDNAIAEDAEFGFYPHDRCGSFYLSLTTDPERANQALDIAKKELQRVGDDLTDEEVQRAKNKIATAIVLEGEMPMGRMRAIAGNWVYNREYRSLEMDMATLEGVTTASLRGLMGEYPLELKTVVTLGPPAPRD
jgi:predicted Zn-dependent peptidase